MASDVPPEIESVHVEEKNAKDDLTATGTAIRNGDPAVPNPQHYQCTFSLIPAYATKHWQCSCTLCATLLVVFIALALGLLAGIIFVAVKANQRSEHNITLSTYKEVLGLSATTDHLYLEKVCIRAPEASNSPPISTQVHLATMHMECSKVATTTTSFGFKGVLLRGLQGSTAWQQQMVDHDLVFNWHKGTQIRLNTSLINFDERGVTIYILTNRRAAYLCSVDHIIPKFYVKKWPVNLGSKQCTIFNDSNDFSCEFNFGVLQSNTYFVCFYKTKCINEDPRNVTYIYNLETNLTVYDTSPAKPVHSCHLNDSNTPCCASYGGKFTGLWHKQCHFIKTDVPNNINDLGIDFTVTVSSHQRLHVIGLSVGLLFICIIIAVILFVLCVATLHKGRNENVGDCRCCLSCHLYGQHRAYQCVPLHREQ